MRQLEPRKDTEIDGSGDVVVSGEVDFQRLEIDGSGDYWALDLTSARGVLDINGSGDADVFVTEELRIRINGSGDVHYAGGAQLITEINGSGDIDAVD